MSSKGATSSNSFQLLQILDQSSHYKGRFKSTSFDGSGQEEVQERKQKRHQNHDESMDNSWKRAQDFVIQDFLKSNTYTQEIYSFPSSSLSSSFNATSSLFKHDNKNAALSNKKTVTNKNMNSSHNNTHQSIINHNFINTKDDSSTGNGTIGNNGNISTMVNDLNSYLDIQDDGQSILNYLKESTYSDDVYGEIQLLFGMSITEAVSQYQQAPISSQQRKDALARLTQIKHHLLGRGNKTNQI